MGIDSIDYILPKITNNNFKKDLAAQLAGYLNFINRASSKLHDLNKCPQDLGFLTKIPLCVLIKLKMCVDNSESHIAEMMIEGSTKGLIEVQRIFNRAKNLDGDISQIGCETIYFEQKCINKLRNYL
jgi:hypothetical protein